MVSVDYPLIVIIGGTTKAGTTSLYYYLHSHPEVCGSSLKETRYFLDDDYPLQSKYRYSHDSIEKFLEYFNDPNRQKKVWVEATPDYLYSTSTPDRIRQALPETKVIFILREPISRVMSWYHFALQTGLLSPKFSPDEYVCVQLESTTHSKEQCWRVVEQGRYVKYLRKWFEIFGSENIYIMFLEELASSPRIQMETLSQFLGLDTCFYENHEFGKFNKTEGMRVIAVHKFYRSMKKVIREKIFHYPRIHAILRSILRKIDFLYLKINRVSKTEKHSLSETTLYALHEYYRAANNQLADLLGRSLPPSWSGQ